MESISNNDRLVDETLSLLSKGEENVNFGHSTHRVMLIGNTGAGKSTLSKFLAGDINSLKAVKRGMCYLIEDGNKISKSTMISKSTFPELMLHKSTNTSYIDCPGFEDSRDASHEIAGTYFTKKVVDSAERIKIIILVDCYSLTIGGNRQDFKTLLKHTAQFIKHVENYRDGIAMVVTKVHPDEFSDDEVIESTVQFLKEAKHDVRDTNISKDLIRNVEILIEVLLMKVGGKYKRIGLFRRPKEVGSISTMPSYESAKESIENLIHYNVHFVEANQQDFGFTLSDTAKEIISDLRDAMNTNITKIMHSIMSKIWSYFILREENYSLRLEFIERLDRDINILKDMDKQASETTEPSEFVAVITQGLRDLNLTEIIDECEIMKKMADHLNFLQIISGKVLSITQKGFAIHVIKGLEDTRNWFLFLIQLHIKLVRCGVPRSKKLPIGEIPSDTHYTVITFLEEIQSYGINSFDCVKDIHVDKTKLKALNERLNATTQLELKITYPEPERLVATAEILQLSHVDTSRLPQAVKCIEIFASDTIVIDEDIIKPGRQLQVYILAPRWEVKGKRKIELAGSNGERPVDAKAHAGRGDGRRGEDGISGKPGGNGGSFFGIGKIFVNGENLDILCRGGNGGKGQDGGDGAIGKHGNDADLHSKEREADVITEGISLGFVRVTVTKDGSPGGRGGDGGDGGIGGQGGFGGDIIVHALGESSNIIYESGDGLAGEGGAGGAGGEGGRDGNGIQCEYEQAVHVGHVYEAVKHLGQFLLHLNEDFVPAWTKILTPKGNGNPGWTGRSNTNAKEMSHVCHKTPMRKKESIIAFKEFLKNVIPFCLETRNQSQFLADLDSNSYIQKLLESP